MLKCSQYCATAYTTYLASSGANNHQQLIGRFITERSLISEKQQQVPRHVSHDGIVDELTNLIFAGTDTTGSALTYLFWELAHHPEWQVQLREELKGALHQRKEYSYSEITELPILEAVVQELFRLRPSSIGPLPRLVPDAGCIIDGTFVPASVSFLFSSLRSLGQCSCCRNIMADLRCRQPSRANR